MLVVNSAVEISSLVSKEKHNHRKIALVPTMGYLHAGHAALIEAAKKENFFTIVYIFVNPAQFNNQSDFENYPVDHSRDQSFCEKLGVDVIFLPGVKEIYPDGIPDLNMAIPHLMKNLCATARPGHFEGVLLVLSRMFHIIRPNIVFLGKKDYQQYKIMDYYCRAVALPLDVRGIDTIRDTDGLALSSRNARLTDETRKSAVRIPEALFHAASMIRNGEKKAETIKIAINEILATGPYNKIDYIEILDPETLEKREVISLPILLAVAVFTDDVRLIDNIIIDAE